jgi:hypothetical protein
MTATEAEVTAVHAPGTAVASYAAGQAEEYRPRIVMAAEDAKALDDQLRAMQLAVLRPKVDYDTIPGMGDKPTLLKPGAEKLIQWFGFGSRSVEIKTELDDPERPSGVADAARRVGVTYRTDVTKTIPGVGEILVARCEGYAGYDEDRFFQTAEQARAKAKANEEKWAKNDGRKPRTWKWENATGHRAPWNTLIKMAQKRSYVGAAIDATAAAGLFTQDLEDMPQSAAGNDGAAAAPDDAWENAAPAPPRQGRKADRSGGTPDDDQWYVRPEPGPATPPPDDGWGGVDQAIKDAASFKTEAAGTRLWREAAAARLAGKCTTEEATKIQNIISARITDRRTEAMERLLLHLSEDDDWRDKVRGLTDDDEAREAIEELGRLKGAGTMNETRAGRIAAAVIARFPKAALKAGEVDG